VYLTADSYEGPAVTVAAEDLDRLWRVFNRAFVVVFPPARRAEVMAILGAEAEDRAMYLAAYERAVTELAEGEDAYGWFNLGSSQVGLGDLGAAARAFDRARALGLPWRMLWYQHGPFEAYAGVGRWPDVLALAEANLRNAGNLEESLYWRGRARAAQGDPAGARADFQRALTLNPGFAPAAAALRGGS
jgi:tetratricopeptide (TPR) repeat protein